MCDFTNKMLVSFNLSVFLKKCVHRPFSVALYLLFYAAFNPSANATDQQNLMNIQHNIALQEQHIKHHLQERNTLRTQLQQQEHTIKHIDQRLQKTENQLSLLQKEITSLNLTTEAMHKSYQQQQHYLAQQLDAAFRQGKPPSLARLLTPQQSDLNARMLAYYSYLNATRQQTMRHLTTIQQQLTVKKQAIAQKQQQQTTLLSQQTAEKNRLHQIHAQHRTTLSSLEKNLQKEQQKLAELRRNEQKLLEKITIAEQKNRARSLQEAEAARKVTQKEQRAKQAGTVYLPTPQERELMARTGGLGAPSSQYLPPVKGSVLHHFGDPIQGELRWKAIVISTPAGSQVNAIADGRVILSDWLHGYGLVLVVDHGKGDMSVYGYTQQALVKVGSQVKQGQPIAVVGEKGSPHSAALYFEIRRQGKAVNPQPWLRTG